jgi:hypothetical protein
MPIARRAQRREARRRPLVRGAVMRPPARREALGRGLQHEAHRHRRRAQFHDFRAGHHAGIQVRQQRRFIEHERGHAPEVLERRRGTESLEPVASRAVAQLRLVAQREERLATTGRLARARDLEHLLGREVGTDQTPRHLGERAVVADVAA